MGYPGGCGTAGKSHAMNANSVASPPAADGYIVDA